MIKQPVLKFVLQTLLRYRDQQK